jgi:hypothetical protein
LSLRGFLVFLFLVVPWYAYMATRFPHFLSAHFVNEQLGACLDTRYPVDAKQLSLAQFYLQHLLFWMPWTMLLPASIYLAIKTGHTVRQNSSIISPAHLDIIRMLACWVVLTMVSVAFSTRQDYYSMCCWGVIGAFLAMPWVATELFLPRLPSPFLLIPCVLVTLGGAVALGFAVWITPRLGALGATTAAPIRERDTFMDAIAGISPALWGHFIVLLGIFGAAMLIAGGVAAVLTRQRSPFPALLVLSVAMAVPVCLATVGFSMMSPYFSLVDEARAINREIATKPDAVVACEALPHTASSLYYYLNARVHWVNAPFDQEYPQRVLDLGRDYYWDEAGLRKAWLSSQPVYFIIEESRLTYWQGLLPPGARVVNKSGTRLVLCNQ